jgi:putative CocE/NonD family hydrolase
VRRPASTTRARIACALTVAAALGAGVLSPSAGASPSSGATAQAAYTVQSLHFKVKVGPKLDQPCDIVGDLYLPRGASSTRRVPAVLSTNGFGGSKDDQAGAAKAFASRGYAFLTYSGLGFGGSTCKITLDDPTYDGVAARQLVSYLGGAAGIAYTDAAHTRPAPRVTAVRHDRRDHLGRVSAHDPRVGMVGGSYGGEIQFAAASVDPRIDTIIPMITWNDLSYSLDPNNTDQVRGVTYRTPGAIKLTWGLGFSALGMAQGVEHTVDDPARVFACPNFADWVCPALTTAGTTGFFQPDAIRATRHASVSTYLRRIRIPVLLMQGQADTLFNLNEAIATFTALKAQRTPVKMIWQHWGHSGPAKPGEFDFAAPDPRTQYDTKRVLAWFDHYLKGARVSTGPTFAWFRDWVGYTGIATPAYGTSSRFPVGSTTSFRLSGSDRLVRSSTAVQTGVGRFTTPPAGAPAQLTPFDAFGGLVPVPVPAAELQGTYAAWTSGKLTQPLDVVGSPKLTVKLYAPSAAPWVASPGSQLVLFVRVEDVAPDGTSSRIHGLVAPIRIPDPTDIIRVTLPAIVHRFAPGHSVRLVIAGSDLNYRGGLAATAVSIASGASQLLTLPVTR